MSGEISELQIAQILISFRAFGEIMGVPPGQLESILARTKDQLGSPFDGPPGPPGPPPTP